MTDVEIDVAALEKRMDGALSALRTEFASLRTGRASASMLDPVTVEAYGSSMPVNQLGTITVPEPRMVLDFHGSAVQPHQERHRRPRLQPETPERDLNLQQTSRPGSDARALPHVGSARRVTHQHRGLQRP